MIIFYHLMHKQSNPNMMHHSSLVYLWVVKVNPMILIMQK
jgi:hypothetical protein